MCHPGVAAIPTRSQQAAAPAVPDRPSARAGGWSRISVVMPFRGWRQVGGATVLGHAEHESARGTRAATKVAGRLPAERAARPGCGGAGGSSCFDPLDHRRCFRGGREAGTATFMRIRSSSRVAVDEGDSGKRRRCLPNRGCLGHGKGKPAGRFGCGFGGTSTRYTSGRATSRGAGMTASRFQRSSRKRHALGCSPSLQALVTAEGLARGFPSTD